MQITNNAGQLTEAEKAHLQQTRWFSYVYGVGLIFLSNGSWNCTDTTGAKAFLEQNGIPEVDRDTSYQNL